MHQPSTSACAALLAIAAALGSPRPAQAFAPEDDLVQSYGDRAMVSLATGHRQPLRLAPAVATVITAEDIAALGAVDLDDVLETVPGMHVARAANLYTPLFINRGIYSAFNAQILLLQNGVPMTTLFVGNKGNIWGGYPVEHIARIEVMRGPGSALYGADAYAGVINIVTRSAADIAGTQLGVRAGSFGTADGWLLHGGRWGALDVAAHLRLGTSDGFRSTVDADAQSRNDAFFGTRASLAPGPVATGRDALDGHVELANGPWRLHGSVKLRRHVGTGAGISSALDPVGHAASQRSTADLSWTQPLDGRPWTLGVAASFLHYVQRSQDFVLLPPGTRLPTGSFPDGMRGLPDTWERQWRLSAFASHTGWAGHRLRLGVGWEDLDLYRTREHKNFSFSGTVPAPAGTLRDVSGSAPFMWPQRRRVLYGYLQDEWRMMKDWTLTFGVRHDHFSDFGSTTNPRLSLVWDAAFDLTVKALYGSAFRAPSFHDQHSINNPVIRGNPDVRPETIDTLELALSWQPRPALSVQATAFHYRMRDIIRAVPNTAPALGSTVRNTGRQSGRGVELEVAWDAGRALRLVAHGARQRATDEASGRDAGYAPHLDLHARAEWRTAGGWLASAQANRVAGRQRAAGDMRPPVADYTAVDLSLRTLPGPQRWSAAVTLRNAFNADVREPSLAPGLIPRDLPQAPRALYAEVGWTL